MHFSLLYANRNEFLIFFFCFDRYQIGYMRVWNVSVKNTTVIVYFLDWLYVCVCTLISRKKKRRIFKSIHNNECTQQIHCPSNACICLVSVQCFHKIAFISRVNGISCLFLSVFRATLSIFFL